MCDKSFSGLANSVGTSWEHVHDADPLAFAKGPSLGADQQAVPRVTRHTLASNFSMQPAPDTTAFTGHFVSGAAGGPAVPATPGSSTNLSAATIPFETCRMRLSD